MSQVAECIGEQRELSNIARYPHKVDPFQGQSLCRFARKATEICLKEESREGVGKFSHDVIEDGNERRHSDTGAYQHDSFTRDNRLHRTGKWSVDNENEFSRYGNFPPAIPRSPPLRLLRMEFEIENFLVEFAGPITPHENRQCERRPLWLNDEIYNRKRMPFEGGEVLAL